MDKQKHITRVQEYYRASRRGYDRLLGGAKHFGYHPESSGTSEYTAIRAMHDLLASTLNLKEGTRALDAGCGQGVVAIDLSKRYGCSITGVTVVPFEVDVARANAQKQSVAHATQFFLADYSKLPFAKGSFDVAYTMESLTHAMSVADVLKEFHRVIKPGGRLALFEYSIASDDALTQRQRRVLSRIVEGAALRGLHQFRHDAFLPVLADAGFEQISCRCISDHVRPSVARLRRYALLPYLFVRAFGWQAKFPNVSAAVEMYALGELDLMRYNVYTATRPLVPTAPAVGTVP